MRTHTFIRPLAAVVLAAGALAVTACGEEEASGGSSSGGDRQSQARDAMLDYARCMRDNGIDMPDPQFDGGRITQRGPEERVSPEKLRQAEEACKEHQEKIEPPELSEEQSQEMQEAALAHARCMREQGIENFPDPTFDEDGGAQIRIGPGTGLDPDDPDFQEAQKACEDEMPNLDGEPGQEQSP
jgi:hypothetical protein